MRRWVICIDGTWNSSLRTRHGPHATNVEKVARLVAQVSSDSRSQIVQYFDGVGGEGALLERAYAGATGRGFSTTVKKAYRFLVENYIDEDEIFLFGFSRGAFTVRCLMGMIARVGLLRVEHANRLHEAYAIYQHLDEMSSKPMEYRQHFSRAIPIKFVGLWDTVGALGPVVLSPESDLWGRYSYTLPSFVEHAFHALAIHERRRAFAPMVWYQRAQSTWLEQCWFLGVHSDVGGGYQEHGLSDIALRWMIHNAESCGLEFRANEVDRATRPSIHDTLHDSMNWKYQLFGTYERPICEDSGLGGSLEYLHTSVLEFIEAYPERCPSNLLLAIGRNHA